MSGTAITPTCRNFATYLTDVRVPCASRDGTVWSATSPKQQVCLRRYHPGGYPCLPTSTPKVLITLLPVEALRIPLPRTRLPRRALHGPKVCLLLYSGPC